MGNLEKLIAGFRKRISDNKYWAANVIEDRALETLLRICEVQAKVLEHYSNHESVIKEAYHSNDERQLTCVHTFINHKADEALAEV